MAQTHNTHLADKAALRCAHLPVDPVRVLDCYGGRGKVWAAVKRLTGRDDIKALPIDMIDYGFHLHGDNRSYLSSIDLSRFNVIDLDAYGIPADQLATLFDRGYTGVVFVTFIQSIYGQMAYRILTDIGFTNEMIEKSPTLFGKRGWQYFLEWLALHGVRQIWHRSKAGKHYLGFDLGNNGSGEVGRGIPEMTKAGG